MAPDMSIPIVLTNNWFAKLLAKYNLIGSTSGHYNITLWPFILSSYEPGEETINHETIHIAQYNELLVVGFLVVYGWDYLQGLIKYRNDYQGFSSASQKAYYRIRAEQEAYEYDEDLEYLARRKKWEYLSKYRV